MKFAKVLQQYTTCNVTMSTLSPGIAQKYTSSILNNTSSIPQLEEIINEMQLIYHTLSGFTDLWHYLCSQWILSQEKVSVFNSISKILRVSQLAIAVMTIIIHNHRLDLIYDIINQLEIELCNMKHCMKVEVQSAIALDEVTRNIISDSLPRVFNLTVIPEFIVDESLIGGFSIYGDSLMLDVSFKGRINQLKKEFNIQ